jgi:hypothetical protein
MSGHTLPYDLNSAPFEMQDPGPGVQFSPDRWNASIALVIASGDESVQGPFTDEAGGMELFPPTADGQRLRVTCVSRAGSGVRALRAINSTGDGESVFYTNGLGGLSGTQVPTLLFNAAGETVVLESLPKAGGGYVWHAIYISGATDG